MIGILTFHWADDCGAMLQGYALKTFINKYQKAIFIPYFPKPLRSRYWLIRFYKKDRLWRKGYKMIRQLVPWNFYRSVRTKSYMCDFRKNYLLEDRRRLSTSREIYESSKEIQTYVVGSDQVWNPEITEGLQEGYFCTFRQWKKDSARYLTYAASIGSDHLEEKYYKSFSNLLKNFDTISLREAGALPFMRKMCSQDLKVVLDPVFLLEKEEWEALIGKSIKRKRGYIAVYHTEYNQEMANYLNQLETATGLDVLIINPGKIHWTENEKCTVGYGPLKFLELIYHADYIVTNSFHGTSFSIIFQKQFLVFRHSTFGARVRDLLKASCLERRAVSMADEAAERMDENIDWEHARAALREKIEYSRNYIKEEIV